MGNDERHRDTRRAVQQEGGAPGRETPWEGSEGFLRALIQSTSDIVVVLDAKGTVRYENSAAERVLGYRPEERIGTSAFDHVHADDLEKVREEFARTLAKPGINPPMRFRMRHADGSWRHIETVRNNLLDDPVIRGIVNVSRDVTEREEVLETLQRSKAEFRAIFDRSAVGMALVDKEGRLKESNSALQTMLGYGAEELQMMRFGDVTHPDDVAADIEHFEKMMAGELDHFRLEKRYIRKDGSLIWGHLTSSVIHGERESPRLMVGMVEDITERKSAEDALRASEERFRGAFENASTGMALVDLDRRFLRVNHALCEMFGYSEEELLSRSTQQITHPDDLEAGEERTEWLLNGETGDHSLEKRYVHTDGHTVWVISDISLIRDSEDSPSHFISMFQDVTERKRAEKSLRASEERFRSVVNNSSEIIKIVGLDGTLRYASPAFERLLGYDPGEAVGMNVLDYVHPEDLPRVLEETEKTMNEPGVGRNTSEYRFRHKDGSWRWIEAAGTYLLDEPGIEGVLINERDITDRKTKEARLRLLESVAVNANDAIMISEGWPLDEPGPRVVYVNETFTRMTGYEPEEVIGKTPRFLQGPGTDRAQLDKIRESLNKWEPMRVEVLNYRKDGTEFWVELNITPVADESGRVTHWVSVQRETTERRRMEEDLRASEERFRRLVQQTPEMIAVHSAGKFVFINAAGAELLGAASPEELIGKPVMDFVHPDYRELVRSRMDQTEGEGRAADLVHEKFLRTDGSTIDVEVTSMPMTYQGRPATQAIAKDVTERLRAEKDLRESEERYRAVVEQSVESIYLFDPDTKQILEANAALEELLGYTSGELSGMTLYDIVAHPPEDIDLTVERHLLEGQRFVGERRYRRKDGSVIQVGVSATVIPYQDGNAICAVARDVTEQKALEEQLKHQAFHDPLTDLPNRALFLDRLAHALSSVRRERGSVAVLFVDLDDFKSINDSLGHEAGDLLLSQVAWRLGSCVRPGDTVARLFGDEFSILLDSPAEVEEAQRVTERIMARLRAPFHLGGKEVFVSSSIGIASGPVSDSPEREQPKDVLHRADLAMYAAKSSGKSQYEVFNPSMNTRAVQRMELKTELRRGVENNEFEVHYQPIVEAETGDMCGLESLVRWRHPERGLVAAEEFIELAEDTGLIHPIGGAVFEQVCRQTKRWSEDGLAPPFLMSVNFSANQFADQADTISRILGETGLDPKTLMIEITERAVMDNAEFALGKLKRLKGLGVNFAIDDYGTGYSCLRYLKVMPVDFLKIDGVFIAGLGKDPGDMAIVHGTIDLAHALGLKVIAEGVETADQYARLRNLGCDMVQGFHFSRPLSASDASSLLKNRLCLQG